jgi:exoribonuclease-2
MVRLEGLPLTARVPSLPELEPGVRVRLELEEIDLFERSLACVYRETLSGDGGSSTPAALQESH